MKIEFDETSLWNLEQFFNEEDTENVSSQINHYTLARQSNYFVLTTIEKCFDKGADANLPFEVSARGSVRRVLCEER